MRHMTHPLIRFVETPDGAVDGAVEDTTADADEATVDSSDETSGEQADAPEAWDQARALDKIRKTNAENKALRERAKAAESKASSMDDVTRERDELAMQVLRLQTAVKFGLDPKIAARLQGSTEEEMAQDAQDLLEMFAPKVPPSQTPRSAAGSAPRVEPGHVETADETWARMRAHRR